MEAGDDRGPAPQGRRGPARPPEGRDEFNLVEFPLTLLTDRAPRGQKTPEWEDEITELRRGSPHPSGVGGIAALRPCYGLAILYNCTL